MTHKPLLAALLLTASLAAAGCGGNDNKTSSSSSSDTTAAASTPSDTSSTDTTSSDSGGGTDVANDPRVKEAVQRCKDSIDQNPQVKDDVKGDLKAICDKAASGNAEDLKNAIKEVCVKIVESSVPEGAARDQAKAACNSAS